jgi:hypothetical protein
MLFSPSFEGRSSASGRFPGAPLVPSYAEVAHDKGKAPMVEQGPSNPKPAVTTEGRSSGGILADARRAHAGRQALKQPRRPPSNEGWQVICKCKQ